ncbi:MAG: hypothetical protein WKF47_16005 [Geodermatophilaceae bacterium]
MARIEFPLMRRRIWFDLVDRYVDSDMVAMDTVLPAVDNGLPQKWSASGDRGNRRSVGAAASN